MSAMVAVNGWLIDCTSQSVMPHSMYVPRFCCTHFEAVAIEGCKGSLLPIRDSFPESNRLDLPSEMIFAYPCRKAAMQTEGCTATWMTAAYLRPLHPLLHVLKILADVIFMNPHQNRKM